MRGATALDTARRIWLARPDTVAVRRALERYAHGAVLSQCSVLRDLMVDRPTGLGLVETLITPVSNALKLDPMSEAPFRFRVSRGFARLELLRHEGASLNLAVYEPLERKNEAASSFSASPFSTSNVSTSVIFSDREVHELVLAGKGSGFIYRHTGEGALSSEARLWSAGDTIRCTDHGQTREILQVERALLLLELAREPQRPAPVREVALDTGETLRTASGDKSASEAMMALSVLGTLGDDSALEVMECMALKREEAPDLRWEAVRQALALDARRGLDLLGRLAAGGPDPLAQPALSLRARLLQEQPELRSLVQTCPA
jgi:hypothetical protein